MTVPCGCLSRVLCWPPAFLLAAALEHGEKGPAVSGGTNPQAERARARPGGAVAGSPDRGPVWNKHGRTEGSCLYS